MRISIKMQWLTIEYIKWTILCFIQRTFRSITKPAKTTGESCAENVQQQVAELLERYGNSILRLAYSYLHNMSDAEDILQDTMIQFLKVAPKFENTSHEKAWMLRVAANLSKNKIEYNKYRMTDELDETLTAEGREDLAFVWDAVKQLPNPFREVIHLFYYEGLTLTQFSRHKELVLY